MLGLASVQNINYLSAQEDVKERTQTYAMTSDVRLKFGSIETEFAYNKHAAKQWGEALLFNFNIEQYKSVLPFSVILGVHRISPNFISQSTEVLMNTNTSLTFNPNLPNKSTISEIDHLNNNSQGVKVQLTSVLTPNITHRKDMLKLYLGWQARKEIQKSNQGFNYFHRINGFILGKLFGFNAGPYDRFTSLFWEYVESVDQLDTSAVSTTDKAFTNIEAKMTYYGKVRKRDFLFNYVFYGASAQRNWSFGLKTKGEYLHIIAHDIESVWNICPKVNVLQYMGYQHSKGHELTEVNTLNDNGTVASLKPRDQHEYQIGLGIEYNVFNRATLSLRNQWFWHQDKNFADDKYAGSYTLLEYKINF